MLMTCSWRMRMATTRLIDAAVAELVVVMSPLAESPTRTARLTVRTKAKSRR